MLRGAAPLEDVFWHARPPHSRERLTDLLLKLAVHSIQRVLAKLHMTAERPVKQRAGGFASSDTSSAPSRDRWIRTIALMTWPLDSTRWSYHTGPRLHVSPDRSLGLSAWELYGTVSLPPADSATCVNLDGLTVSDRDYQRGLLPSGT